jgi:ABC-type xylose transport system permease subunit
MIVIGWGFIFKKEHFFKWAVKKYKSLAVIVLNLIVIFAVINFIAALFLYQPQKVQKTGAQSKSTAFGTIDERTAGTIIFEELPIIRLYRMMIGDTEEHK